MIDWARVLIGVWFGCSLIWWILDIDILRMTIAGLSTIISAMTYIKYQQRSPR